ncbi:MAG TPA: GNAT family N-acetyltransferase [Acidimicrobiales bacterium]|nr:GNAT family N-acetyltransferase [Acidimicrobiales bacterium]
MARYHLRAVDSPGEVLTEAAELLVSDPVRHNLVLTLLHARASHPQPGRYWLVSEGHRPTGVVFQSPLEFFATLTPMAAEAVAAAVDGIVDAGANLPGVSGEVSSAARFSGRWAERTGDPVRPDLAQRLYELGPRLTPGTTTGRLRDATPADRQLLLSWFKGFADETGESAGHLPEIVDLRVAKGLIAIWDDGGPVSMAARTAEVAGVVRIGPVYTPPDRRNQGYGMAVVASVSSELRSQGLRSILYTDLANPVSNSIYRRIGYEPVEEIIRYRFG